MKWTKQPSNRALAAKARIAHCRVHYKQTREILKELKGKSMAKAQAYLRDVLAYKQAVPFTKYTGGIGRHAQGKNLNAPGSKCRWPQKATRAVLGLVENAESNAETRNLDVERLVVTHAQSNRAPQHRRRTYRAHGRINGYKRSPAHMDLIFEPEAEEVERASGADRPVRLSRRALAQRQRVPVGGDS